MLKKIAEKLEEYYNSDVVGIKLILKILCTIDNIPADRERKYIPWIIKSLHRKYQQNIPINILDMICDINSVKIRRKIIDYICYCDYQNNNNIATAERIDIYWKWTAAKWKISEFSLTILAYLVPKYFYKSLGTNITISSVDAAKSYKILELYFSSII